MQILYQLRRHIANRGGLYFRDHDLKNLETVVAARMADTRMDSMAAYYSYLTASERKEDEFRELLNLLTINHTYFFRNEPQFDILKDKILPGIVAEKLRQLHGGDVPVLKVWSAGCSTGEEPYSLAMTILETIENLGQWDVRIFATDASQKALSAAKQGVYSKNALKLVKDEYIGKYFEAAGNSLESRLKVKQQVRDMVEFAYFNLMEDVYPAQCDIIFCRNVVIYFDGDTTARVMNKFHESVNDGGYLFLGYSESLQYLSTGFKMQFSQDAIYYVKEAGALPAWELAPAGSLEPVVTREEDAMLPAPAPPSGPPVRRQTSIQEITRAMYAKNYSKALILIEDLLDTNPSQPEVCYLAAEIYFTQGQAERAREWLDKLIKTNPMFAPGHHLRGMMLMETGMTDKAKESFKKALYLDKGFLMAHFSLANILKSENNYASARREYRNTLNCLPSQNPDDIVAYGGGFNNAALISACKSNLETLKGAV